MAPTIKIIREQWNNGSYYWTDAQTLSNQGTYDGWWIANAGLGENAGPFGYSWTWRFYAWTKKGETWRVLQNSEVYKDSSGDAVFKPASLFLSPGSVVELAGWGNETWVWWFDVWNIVGYTHTIYYNGNYNTGGDTGSTSAVYPNSIYIAQNGFTRTGYNFNGWGLNQNSTTASYYEGSSFNHPGTSGSTTLYALWSAKPYTLTIVNYTGLANTTYTVYYNNSITVTGGTRPGHTFVKFTSNFGDIYNGTFTWNRDSNETLTSVWSIIPYTVTFNNNGKGSITRSVIQYYGTSITLPIFKAIGYTFDGWSENINGAKVNYASFTLNQDKSFFARWTINTIIKFSELNIVYNVTRGSNPPDRGAASISIGKFRAESGQTGTNQIKLITNFLGKG